MSSRYAEAKTCVFWNIEDSPIPSGLDPESVVENIKSALAKKGYRGEVTIRAYGDMYQIQDYYQSAGIELIRDRDRCDRVVKMHIHFYGWLLANAGLTNMMVISADNSDFERFLTSGEAARHNILLAEPEDAPRRCCSSCYKFHATDEWLWESLSAGGDPITRAY